LIFPERHYCSFQSLCSRFRRDWNTRLNRGYAHSSFPAHNFRNFNLVKTLFMKNYETVSEAVNDLVRRGYDHDLNIEGDILVSSKNHQLSPEEFEIDEIYRFEGDTDPGDENIVYAISSVKKKMKGILVNAYGHYADAASSELMSKLHRHVSE